MTLKRLTPPRSAISPGVSASSSTRRTAGPGEKPTGTISTWVISPSYSEIRRPSRQTRPGRGLLRAQERCCSLRRAPGQVCRLTTSPTTTTTTTTTRARLGMVARAEAMPSGAEGPSLSSLAACTCHDRRFSILQSSPSILGLLSNQSRRPPSSTGSGNNAADPLDLSVRSSSRVGRQGAGDRKLALGVVFRLRRSHVAL